MNEMYHKMENDARLKGKVKLIGIGVGNTVFEVNHFKKTYNIPFPLFPDGDFVIHKMLGEVRTPYFIGVNNLANGNHRVYYSKLGGGKNADELLEKLLKGSGLQ